MGASGLEIWGLGIGDWGSELRDWRLRVYVLMGFGAWGLRCAALGLGFEAYCFVVWFRNSKLRLSWLAVKELSSENRNTK